MGAKYKAIYREGRLFAEYENGELVYLDPLYSGEKRSDLPTPMIMRDIGEYRSTLDGTMITSRPQHRDHMRKHDVVEVGNEKVGKMAAAAQAASSGVDRDLAMAIKRRIEEVKELSQSEYDTQIQTQQGEHADVAALITTAA